MTTHGDSPGPLAHHKACVYNQCMYIFGGINGHDENVDSFYSLDMNSFKWSKFEAEGQPEARDDHSVSHDGDDLYLFGGFVNGVRHNDLYKLNFATNEWTLLSEHREVEDSEKTTHPCPRSGQAIGAQNGKVYVFGGRNDYNEMLDDTWEFDIASKRWTLIESDNHPIGRSCHTLTVDNASRMILFGGIVDITKEINELHQFNFSKRDWEDIDDDIPHADGIERSPSPRKR